jgi:hypothetical protein
MTETDFKNAVQIPLSGGRFSVLLTCTARFRHTWRNEADSATELIRKKARQSLAVGPSATAITLVAFSGINVAQP